MVRRRTNLGKRRREVVRRLRLATLSLSRQLRKSRAALPPNWVIVAHYYDVESGRKDLDLRGRGTGHEQFEIPIRATAASRTC